MSRMLKRLQKQYQYTNKNSDTFIVTLPTNQLKTWHVSFQGAKNTIYQGQKFKLQFIFGNDYVSKYRIQPIQSPQVIFIGKPPEHQQIYSNGFICLSILYDQWSPSFTTHSICISILSMLSSSTKKMKPKNDSEFIKKAVGRSPKSFLWNYGD